MELALKTESVFLYYNGSLESRAIGDSPMRIDCREAGLGLFADVGQGPLDLYLHPEQRG